LLDLTLILPAYNEARSITDTIREARSYFDRRGLRYQVVVAADGDDGTREMLSAQAKEESWLTVIGGPAPRGKGRAIREAVSLARGAIVGYADADNKVPIDELDKVLPWFAEGYDMVIGSRGMRESAIERRQPLYRRVGAVGFSWFMHSVVGLRAITDTQCGFKFFTRAAAAALFSRQKIDGYMFDVEILTIAARLGCRVRQVPIRWRDDGDSRLQLLRGNIRNVIDIFRIRRSL
jgi:dolichyl-phosphate beta-glucosyltransferase